MKFKRQQITAAIHGDGGQPTRTEPFDALVLGQLAVHRGLLTMTYEAKGDWYVVTHIPTGFSLADGRQRACRRLIEKLDALGIDWDFTLATEDFIAKAKPIIQAFRG